MVEPVYDPALEAPGETLEPTIVLLEDFSAIGNVSVLRDGLPLPGELVQLAATELTIGPILIDAPTTLTITASGDAIPTLAIWEAVPMLLLVLAAGTLVYAQRNSARA